MPKRVLPLWLMAEGLRRIGANQAALVACIGPISTFVLTRTFLGEPIGAVQLIGRSCGGACHTVCCTV